MASVHSIRKGPGHWGFDLKEGKKASAAKLRLKISGEEVQRSFSYFYYFHVPIVSEGWSVHITVCGGQS